MESALNARSRSAARPSRRGGLAVAVAVSVVVAACASGDDAGGSQQPAVSEPPVSASANTTASADAPSASAEPDGAVDDPPDAATAPAPAPEPTAPPEPTDADDEAFDPEAGPPWTTAGADVLFDPATLHTFEIDVSAEGLAFLDADPAAEEYVEASMRFDGEEVAPVGLRYKGSVGAFLGCTDGPNPFQPSGAKTCRKLSMKIKVNWDDPDREFFGVRRVQLHSQNLDPTKFHERLGYWLFREAGVPAPRSTHARVVLNGEYLGLFALTEQIDGRFTRDRFDDGKGNLYKEVWPFDGTGDVRADAEFRDGLKTNEKDDPSVQPIGDFARAVVESGADALVTWTDRERLLTTFVVDRLIANDDGALHWYCLPECEPHNFFWYEEPLDGAPGARLHLIPWDLDNAFANLSDSSPESAVTAIADDFGVTTNDCEPFPFGPLNILQRSAACDPIVGAAASLTDDIERIRQTIVEGIYSEETVDALLDEWIAQIEPAVAESAAAFDDAPTVEQWLAAVEDLRASLVEARTSAR